jgi:hypothetical protein
MGWTRVILAGVCGALGAVIATAVVGSARERRIYYGAVMVLSFTLLTVASDRYALPYARLLAGAFEAHRALGRKWTPQLVDDSALSLALPDGLQPQAVDLPSEARSLITRFTMSTYERDGISLAVSHALYKPGVPTTLKGAIDGAIANIEKTRGVSKVTDSRRPWEVDGREGAIVDLKVEGKEEEMEGRALFVMQPSELWQVILLYRPTQAAGEQLASTMIDSARFEPQRAVPPH